MLLTCIRVGLLRFMVNVCELVLCNVASAVATQFICNATNINSPIKSQVRDGDGNEIAKHAYRKSYEWCAWFNCWWLMLLLQRQQLQAAIRVRCRLRTKSAIKVTGELAHSVYVYRTERTYRKCRNAVMPVSTVTEFDLMQQWTRQTGGNESIYMWRWQNKNPTNVLPLFHSIFFHCFGAARIQSKFCGNGSSEVSGRLSLVFGRGSMAGKEGRSLLSRIIERTDMIRTQHIINWIDGRHMSCSTM